MKKSIVLFIALALFVPQFCQAGEKYTRAMKESVLTTEFPYEKGNREFQLMAGPYLSFTPDSSSRPTLNYAILSARLGWMLYSPRGHGFFRGNTEFLVEAFGGPIYDGAGSVLAGGTLLLRYNFIQPNARLFPYVQIGAGGVYSDAANDNSQRLIGSDVSFNLQGALGLRYKLCEKWAVSVEGGYRHISNANLASRNTGLDSLGGLVGFSYFF